MEQLNIINGDGRYVKEAVLKMLEPAIKCYGDKYAKIVLDTVKKAYFYEWQDNQSMSKVIQDIIGEKLPSDYIIDEYNYYTEALYLDNETTNNQRDQIIIFKNKLIKENIHSLVHELYGHAVFGHVNYNVIKDGKEYNRNGLALDDNYGQTFDEFTNEGYVDSFANMIMKTAGMEEKLNNAYKFSRFFANIGIQYLGKETVLDHLILNQIDIRTEYNKGTTKDEWQEASTLLDDIFYNFGYDYNYEKVTQNTDKLIDNVSRFVRRKSK